MNQDQDFETRKAGLNAKCEQVVEYAKELGLNCFAMAVVNNGAGAALLSLEKVSLEELDALEDTAKKVLREISKHHLSCLIKAAAEALTEMEDDDD